MILLLSHPASSMLLNGFGSGSAMFFFSSVRFRPRFGREIVEFGGR